MTRYLLIAAVVLGAVACSGSPGSSTSTVITPTPAQASPSPSASPPTGGPAPQQLIGTWINVTPGPYKGRGLTLSANHYVLASHSGDIVVNGTEIDFFNGDTCGLQLPDGVGRYTWNLSGTRVTFTPIDIDPCGRWDDLANATYAKE